MIMKIITSAEDKAEEVFEISNYYTECEDYLEAIIKGDDEKQIILQDGNCMELGAEWDELIIYTDSMAEIVRFAVVEVPE